MPAYEIVGASLSDLTRYTTGEPSLSVVVGIGIGQDGERTMNVTIPVDLNYDPNETLEQIEDRAFAAAVDILKDIGTPVPADLAQLYREQFRGH